MDNTGLTPWLICIGALVVWPAIMFIVGLYIGRHGLPVEITIRRRRKHIDDGGWTVQT